MSTLPLFPTIVGYNGVTFPVETETTDCTVRPVADASGRMVKYHLHSLTLKFVLGQNNQDQGLPTDNDMEDIRERLTAYAGELEFEDVGFGDLIANTPDDGPTLGSGSPAIDVVWGPKPTMLRWKPYGQNACEVVWTVDVAIAPCPDTELYGEGMLEWNWKVSYNIDRSGYTTRAMSGFVRVAGWRGGVDSRTIQDQADRLRETINPAPLPGFRRIPGTFTLSEDKARLDFSVTDEQMPPNVPPPGCVEASATHTMTAGQYFSAVFSGSLTATYEPAPGVPRSAAEVWFNDLVDDRAKKGRGVPFKFGREMGQTSFVPKSIEYSEPDIYGRQAASFRLDYTHATTVGILMKTSGLWKAVPNTNWAQWSASLASTAFHVRGNARLAFKASDEALIDICEEADDLPRRMAGAPPQPPGVPRNLRRELTGETPDPGTSWLHYYCVLRLWFTDETVELKPLPQPSQSDRQPGITRPRPPAPSFEKITGGPGSPTRSLRTAPGSTKGQAEITPSVQSGFRGVALDPVSASPQAAGGGANPSNGSTIQRRTASSFHATLEGFAVRAGHPILPPFLISVGGAAAIPANRAEQGDGYSHGTAAVWFGMPVYFARWQLRYILPTRPDGELPIMGNPFLGV